jgi:hypothetical protein
LPKNYNVSGPLPCHVSCQKLLASPLPIILEEPIEMNVWVYITSFQNGEHHFNEKEVNLRCTNSFQKPIVSLSHYF